MATIGSLALAQDIADVVLDFHIRGDALLQTQQERPLLSFLNQGKETFPGGKQYITTPVQFTVMNDTAGFFAGYSQDDQLSFTQAANIKRAQFAWKECHAGLVITHTELKEGGISVTDGEQATSEHSEIMMIELTKLLKNRVDDYAESWARATNNMLWMDGTQDAKQVPGVLSLLLDSPGTGNIGGLSQLTYAQWRNRSRLDLVASPENQTMSKFFRTEAIQLRRFGGRPNKALCGTAFWEAFASEVEKKGLYTTTGFAKGATDTGMDGIKLPNIGLLEYDPTLDSLGLSKRCYVFDSRRIKLRPMEGEDNKTLEPARPYQYMVLLKSMTWTGGLTVNQLNAMGVYGIA